MIDLDALEVFVEAVTESHNDVTPTEFVLMVRKLDNAGYQITRKPRPAAEIPLPFIEPSSASIAMPRPYGVPVCAPLDEAPF